METLLILAQLSGGPYGTPLPQPQIRTSPMMPLPQVQIPDPMIVIPPQPNYQFENCEQYVTTTGRVVTRCHRF
jgi:hypothetical protein